MPDEAFNTLMSCSNFTNCTQVGFLQKEGGELFVLIAVISRS